MKFTKRILLYLCVYACIFCGIVFCCDNAYAKDKPILLSEARLYSEPIYQNPYVILETHDHPMNVLNKLRGKLNLPKTTYMIISKTDYDSLKIEITNYRREIEAYRYFIAQMQNSSRQTLVYQGFPDASNGIFIESANKVINEQIEAKNEPNNEVVGGIKDEQSKAAPLLQVPSYTPMHDDKQEEKKDKETEESNGDKNSPVVNEADNHPIKYNEQADESADNESLIKEPLEESVEPIIDEPKNELDNGEIIQESNLTDEPKEDNTDNSENILSEEKQTQPSEPIKPVILSLNTTEQTIYIGNSFYIYPTLENATEEDYNDIEWSVIGNSISANKDDTYYNHGIKIRGLMIGDNEISFTYKDQKVSCKVKVITSPTKSYGTNYSQYSMLECSDFDKAVYHIKDISDGDFKGVEFDVQELTVEEVKDMFKNITAFNLYSKSNKTRKYGIYDNVEFIECKIADNGDVRVAFLTL